MENSPCSCTQSAFYPVTGNGIAESPACCNANSRVVQVVWGTDQHDKRVSKGFSITTHPLEIGCAFQSILAPHRS